MITRYPVKVALDPASLPTSGKVPTWTGLTFSLYTLGSSSLPLTNGSNNQVLTDNGSGGINSESGLIYDYGVSSDDGALELHARSSTQTHLELVDDDYSSYKSYIKQDGSGSTSKIGIYDESKSVSIVIVTSTGYIISKKSNSFIQSYAFGAFNYTGNNIVFGATASYINLNVNNQNHFRFLSNGDFLAKNDVVAFSSTLSDIKYKYDIKPIENSLDMVKNLNGRRFKWKEDDREDIGVIAQEIENILPEIVKDKETLNDKEGETSKVVSYQLLTAVLIEAVKELNQKVEELESKINK